MRRGRGGFGYMVEERVGGLRGVGREGAVGVRRVWRRACSTQRPNAKRVRVGPAAAAVRSALHVELADVLERLA